MEKTSAKQLFIPIKDIIIFILLMELAIVPIVPFFLKLILIVFFIILLLVINPKIPTSFFRTTRPLIYILIISVLMGLPIFFSDTSSFLRDGYYFFQPILLIFLGYIALSKGLNFVFLMRLIVLSSLFLTLYFYFDFFLSIFTGQGISFESRYVFGLNSDFAIVGLLICYVSIQSKLRVFSLQTEVLITFLLLILVIFSFSRTNILIAFLIMIYPYVLKLISFRKQMLIVFCVIIIPIFFGSFLNIAVPEEAASNFISKVMNSYSEIIVRDYRDLDAIAPDANVINLYWRSQEAFLGLAKYLEGTPLQLLLGQGLGSYATAEGIFESKFQEIPFFHNGFITIVLKSGPLGILLFFQFLYIFAKSTTKLSSQVTSLNKFLLIISPAIVFVTIIKTFFIMGFYTPESPVLLLTLIGIIIKQSTDSQNNKKLVKV